MSNTKTKPALHLQAISGWENGVCFLEQYAGALEPSDERLLVVLFNENSMCFTETQLETMLEFLRENKSKLK